MPFANSLGRGIYYGRCLRGPAILFCHGAGSNAATWWQQLPVFSAHYTRLTMDIRCFGRSWAPLEEFSLENFVHDLVSLLDQEDIDRVTLVGQSLGGMIGLKMAPNHPQRVAAFVACDSPLGIRHPVVLDILAERQLSQQATAIEQRGLGRWFLPSHPDKVALYAQINHFNPSAYAISPEQWGATLSALMASDRLMPMGALRLLACPTLVLVGRIPSCR